MTSMSFDSYRPGGPPTPRSEVDSYWQNLQRAGRNNPNQTYNNFQQGGGWDQYYGRGSQDAWQAAGSPRSYRPGQAQPIQPQSQGTPYAAYSQPDSNQGLPPSLASGLVQYGAPSGGLGNYANMPADQRPSPFSTSMRTWDGQQMSPSQFYGQRDAFIQQVNDARSQQSALSGLTNGPPQQRDLGGMWNQAGNMQQSGWQNPFSYDSMMGQEPVTFGSFPTRNDQGSGDLTQTYPQQPGVGGWPEPVNPDLDNPYPRAGGRRPFHSQPNVYGQGSVPTFQTPPSAPPPPPPPPPTQPAPAQPVLRRAARTSPGQNADRTDYGAETQAWIDRTRRENNDPNGQMQQMLRGMTPANRRIYSLMMNDFSQQQRSAGIAAARAPMFNAYAARRS